MKQVLAITFILILALSLSFQAKGQECKLVIRGKVIHLENNGSIPGAYVWIDEIKNGTITDDSGNFQFRNLCPGEYTLKIQFLGHQEIIEKITLANSSFNKTFRMEEEATDLGGVEIHGHRDAVQTTTAIAALYGERLLEARGENLGESLKRIAGVTTFSTGNSISKPVIHGLHSNRIMILNNGIRLEGQQWGAEHAPEIDPFLANEITVIKGAETVRFGPEAMGGVILVNPGEIPTGKDHQTDLYLIGGTNGRTGNLSISHASGFEKIAGLGYRVQGSFKRGGNVRSPEYFQGNTGMSELNFSGALNYTSSKIGTELYYSFFNTELGILRDAHTGNLSDLEEIIENGRPFTNADFTYEISNPKQIISHHLAKLKAHYHLNNKWKANLQYGFQLNQRQEYDRRRGDLNSRASLDLELFTNTIDLFVDHTHENALSGTWGINVIQQANSNVPGTGVTPLIPNYDMINAGIYVMEKYSKGPLELEGGLRYDYRTVNTARYIGNELEEADLSYNNVTAFFGTYYQISPTVSFRSNLGSAWRPPNVNELFSQGLHHGAAAVEIGDSDLKSEKSLKWVNSLEFEGKKTTGEITFYANQIRDYIYLNPTGETFVSLRGTFNVYEYLQANAFFWGFDVSGSYEISNSLQAYAKGSIIRARNTDTDEFFPFIPSDRMDWGLQYQLGDESRNHNFSLSNILVARQKREPSFDLAPAPPAYALFNFSYRYQVPFQGNRLNIGFQVQNLFNTEYKEYMNRFRYFTADLGRNILLKINYQF